MFDKIPRKRLKWIKGSFIELARFLFRSEDQKNITLFEHQFAKMIGSKYAISVDSGRAGLRIILDALGLEKGDEIILSAYNSPIVPLVLKEMGIKPVFADIHPETLNMELNEIRRRLTPRTRAILVLHTEGQPSDINRILAFAKNHHLFVIEDCAHAVLAEVSGKKAGSFGDASFFSFGIGKHINTLGGGMVLTNKKSLYLKIKTRIAQSIRTRRKKHTQIIKGFLKAYLAHIATKPLFFSTLVFPIIRVFRFFNKDVVYDLYKDKSHHQDKVRKKETLPAFQLSSFQAWLGLQQLKELGNDVLKRRRNAEYLTEHLRNMRKLSFQKLVKGAKGSFLEFMILTPERDKAIKNLLKNGVDSQKPWLKCCAQATSDCNFVNAHRAENQGVYLPVYAQLERKELDRIIKALRQSY